jgi:hypothetical protein
MSCNGTHSLGSDYDLYCRSRTTTLRHAHPLLTQCPALCVSRQTYTCSVGAVTLRYRFGRFRGRVMVM